MADASSWLADQIEQIEAQAEGEMIGAAAEGFDAYYEIITTRGTGVVPWSQKWWRPDPIPADFTRKGSPQGTSPVMDSAPGRVASGHMRDSLDLKVNEKSVELGFLNEYEDYFEDQELGFWNDEADVQVEGMHAQASVHMVIDDALESQGWKKQ